MTMDSNNCSALVKGGESPKKSKAGLLKDSTSRIGRVLKQNRIKDADNRVPKKKLVPKIPRVTDQFVD